MKEITGTTEIANIVNGYLNTYEAHLATLAGLAEENVRLKAGKDYRGQEAMDEYTRKRKDYLDTDAQRENDNACQNIATAIDGLLSGVPETDPARVEVNTAAGLLVESLKAVLRVTSEGGLANITDELQNRMDGLEKSINGIQENKQAEI